MPEMNDHQLPSEEDLEGLTTAQRVAVALDLLPFFVEPPEQRTGRPGRPRSPEGKATKRVAEIVGIGKTSIETGIAIQKRDSSIIEKMRTGELNLAQGARAVGLARGSKDGYSQSSVMLDASGRSLPSIYYGKGDKWKEAIGPLVRYLTGWEKRGFEFRHVNPKEARRRLALIAEIQSKLEAAKMDLEQRAHSATLTIKRR